MATTEEQLEAKRGVTGAQVALLVGGLVLLLFLVWFFVLRGGSEPAETAPPASSGAPSVAPDDEPQATDEPGKPKKQPVETFELFASKDPFEPLVDPTAATGGTTTGAPTTIGGTGGTTGGNGGTGGTAGGTGGTSGGGETVGGHSVRLVDVFLDKGAPRAQVEVDGTVYTVAEGEVFAENFELVSASGECATMLFGDDQFTLCEGEEILK
jgi:hypothetical protein